MSIKQDYWDALSRLKCNQPIRLPKGSKINNDNVALEAGRKRGSIKKSRESFFELIGEIESVAKEIAAKKLSTNTKLSNDRSKILYYKDLYHQALNRELMLIERLAELEKQIKHCGNVSPIK